MKHDAYTPVTIKTSHRGGEPQTIGHSKVKSVCPLLPLAKVPPKLCGDGQDSLEKCKWSRLSTTATTRRPYFIFFSPSSTRPDIRSDHGGGTTSIKELVIYLMQLFLIDFLPPPQRLKILKLQSPSQGDVLYLAFPTASPRPPFLYYYTEGRSHLRDGPLM